MSDNNLIIYQPQNALSALQVRIENETVWLTQKQIAELFGTEIPAISKHIRNIFSSGELQQVATVSKMEIVQQEGSRTILRHIDFYNLDMILSIGYRVNSIYATHFRIWATTILKDFLLKGFAVNTRFELLENRMSKIESSQSEFVELVNQALPPKQGIFYENQVFDAYKFVNDLVKSAKKSIVLIDNYIDESVLTLFSACKKGVKIAIYTNAISEKLKLDTERYITQYQAINVKTFSKSHDRFLIIDNVVYHFGASLKDLGKKWFAFSKMELKASEILEKLEKF